METKGEWKVVSQYACGCQVREHIRHTLKADISALIIVYCPKHNAAWDMAEALKAYQKANRLHNDGEAELHEQGKAALKKAGVL